METSKSNSGVRYLEILGDHQGQRVDNYLLRLIKGVPRSMIYRVLRQGQVRINGRRVKPDYRLQIGDVMRVPPLYESSQGHEIRLPTALLKQLQSAILYEDQDVLVLNKPSGIPVHRGSRVNFGVIDAMRALRSNDRFLELAHRLDRETSGCLVFAKSSSALRLIHAAFQTGLADKRYLALVRGRWRQGTVEITAPLRKRIRRGNERMVEVDDGGKAACSIFRPISVFPRASLVEVELATGRTHQIRVHAAHGATPLAGDSKYGDPHFNRRMSHLGLRRLFLHAHSLSLPLGNRELAVSAPLTVDLGNVLEQLEGQT